MEELESLKQQETELNRLKNIGLYVSFKNNEFHLPDNTITLSQFIKIEKLSRISLIAVESNIKYIESKGGYDKLKENLEKKLKIGHNYFASLLYRLRLARHYYKYNTF